nr:hypothetical protein BaRGS_011100 [Batillaria attramentaria]
MCPAGWTLEYTGHLMGSYGGYAASSDYVCVDSDQEARPGGQGNQDSQFIYYTIAACGSLPCPPYEDGKILSCVVCSK